MIEQLVRRFVRNPERLDSSHTRMSYTYLAGIVGILCNVSLSLLKLIVGTLTNSFSIVADAANNLSDALSNIVSIVGMKLSDKPADKEHPFGHGRIEYLAALVVATIILSVGFQLLLNSVRKVMHPTFTTFEPIPFVILLLSILVKVWMSHFNKVIGDRIHSLPLQAASADARNDCLVTGATAVALIGEVIFKVHLDGIVSLLVSLFVLYSGFQMISDILTQLIGAPVDPELLANISRTINETPGILANHDLLVHNYGPTHSMASVHLEVAEDMPLVAAHSLADEVERRIAGDFGIQLVAHIDPVSHDELSEQVRDELDGVIRQLNQSNESDKTRRTKSSDDDVNNSADNPLSIHDFRLVPGRKHINIVFDLVLPFEYSDAKQEQIIRTIHDEMHKFNPLYHCHIKCDRS